MSTPSALQVRDSRPPALKWAAAKVSTRRLVLVLVSPVSIAGTCCQAHAAGALLIYQEVLFLNFFNLLPQALHWRSR